MNVKVLRQIQKRLIKQSQDQKHCRFNMNHFIQSTPLAFRTTEQPVCGTQACIAGETLILAGKAKYSRKLKSYVFPETHGNGIASTEHKTAQKILGLTNEEANRLFYFAGWQNSIGWPNDLAAAYQNAESGMESALIGAARIERFIRTEGAN